MRRVTSKRQVYHSSHNTTIADDISDTLGRLQIPDAVCRLMDARGLSARRPSPSAELLPLPALPHH